MRVRVYLLYESEQNYSKLLCHYCVHACMNAGRITDEKCNICIDINMCGADVIKLTNLGMMQLLHHYRIHSDSHCNLQHAY